MSHRLKGVSAALIFCIVSALGQTSQKITSVQTEKPIAMDKSASELFVLSSRGYVSRFRADTLKTVQTFRIQGFAEETTLEPVDLVFTEAYGIKSLFLSGNVSNPFSSYCVILRFSIEGRLLERVLVRTLCAGMDFDEKSRSLYIASSDHKGILRIGVQQSGLGNPEFFEDDPGIKRMGPLVVDSSSQRLFVSDVEGSGIYEFDIDRRTWRNFQVGKGAIRADSLSLDASRKNLYALSGLARIVSVIPIASGEENAKLRIISLPFALPTAITVLEMGKFAIADIEVNKITLLADPDAKATANPAVNSVSLQLQSIKVEHNGAPGSTKWRFDVYVNGSLVATIPQYDFERHLKVVSVNVPEGVSFPPVSIARAGALRIEIRGYGPRGLIPIRGTSHVLLNSSSRTVRVFVKNRPSLFGDFEFTFLIS